MKEQNGNNDIFLQDEIIYNEISHVYKNLSLEEYTSISRLIKTIQVPFNRETISRYMAVSLSKEEGISVDEAQLNILNDWDNISDESIEKGDFIHSSMESYSKTGKYDPRVKVPVEFMSNIFSEYYRFYPEVILHSHKHKIAGRADLVLQRKKSRNSIFDFADYKTNQKKGICFDSIRRNVVPHKHYNKYLLPPFDYLEDCNYIIYAFQLSCYAFMAMTRLDMKIGKLFIIFIDNNFVPSIIPVPFMYHEAKILCESNLTRKKLPDAEDKKLFPLTPDESFQKKNFDINNVREDWD